MKYIFFILFSLSAFTQPPLIFNRVEVDASSVLGSHFSNGLPTPSFVAGNFGQGLEFPQDVITLAYVYWSLDKMFFKTNGFALSIFLRPTNWNWVETASSDGVLHYWAGAMGESSAKPWFFLGLDAATGGNVIFDFNTGSGNDRLSIATITFNSNQWYHVAMVFDGTNQSVYVDGVRRGTRTTLNAKTNFYRRIVLGRQGWSSTLGASGVFDNVKAWNYAKTDWLSDVASERANLNDITKN